MIKNQVRPAMTPEARDVLDAIHAEVGGETRSESIRLFHIRAGSVKADRDFLRVVSKTRSKLAMTRGEKIEQLSKQIQELKVWLSVAGLGFAAALIALALQSDGLL